jgi:CENP-S associating Centromere protein X
MASASSATTTKRRRPAFSPPRPKTSKSTNINGVSKIKTNKKRKSQVATTNKHKASRFSSPTPSATDSEAVSEAESASASAFASPHSEPDYILAEVTHNEKTSENEPIIPSALIHTLLNHHFSDKDRTRISQDAKAVIGKYVDTFVREAIARSALERQEKSAEDATDSLVGRGDDGWLEVEDLEKMAPQLVLDF